MQRTAPNRRQFCLALASAGPALVTTGAVAAAQPLRVLAWPGYADPDVVQAFEQQAGVKVEVTYADTDVVLWQRINQNQGRNFDVFAANTAELQRYIRRGLVAPLDTAALPNLARQLPAFRDLRAIAGLVHDGKTYAVPYAFAEMGLIYDRQQFSSPPESILALWDPAYQGKVIAYNGGAHNFALAAQVLGLPSLFKLSPANWAPAVERLIALRRNAAAFYNEPEESVALFKRHRAALMFANYGNQQFQLTRAAGLDVGYTIPRECALAWLDCWAVMATARQPALAHAWINHMLDAPASEVLTERHGLANTTLAPARAGPSDRRIWLEPVEDEERRNLLWARILSGDRLNKVLAT
jgi:putative spermidine/putrescine transport system substrate-binding protein